MKLHLLLNLAIKQQKNSSNKTKLKQYQITYSEGNDNAFI